MALFFVVFTACMLALAIRKPIDHDEHQFVASGALLAREGLLPYRDYPYHHFPYLTFMYAGLFLATDHLLLSARFLSVAFAVGSALAFFALVRGVFADQPGARRDLLAVAFTTALIVNPLFLYTTGRAWNHDASVLLALLAFGFMVRAPNAENPSRSVLFSGVTLAGAIGVRSSFALLVPGFALGVLLIAVAFPRGRSGINLLIAHGAGLTMGLFPLVPLFAMAPKGFMHGNLRYNLELNPRYRLELGHGIAMSLVGKCSYVVSDVLVARRNSFLLIVYLVSWVCLAFRRRRRYAFPQRFVLVLTPFLVLTAFSATPSWYQYFYPVVPFLLVGIAYAAADGAAMRWRPLAMLCVAVLLFGSALGVHHFWRALRSPDGESAWTATVVHAIGSRIAAVAQTGPVLTLAPILPLEGHLSIFPELATGPFAWRTAALVPPDQHNQLKLAGPQDLGGLLRDRAPSAVLVGAETDPLENLEVPFVQFASSHGYLREALPLGFTLWIRPGFRATPLH